MKEAEKIASEEYIAKKLAVISGIGAKGFFYNLNYIPDGPLLKIWTFVDRHE